MPVRHSPDPPNATTLDTETLKRPTKSRQKANKDNKLSHPSEAEPESPTPQNAAPASDNLPQIPSTPVSAASQATSLEGESPKAKVQRRKSKGESPKSEAAVESPLEETLDFGPSTLDPSAGPINVGGVDFHHASEAEFARLLTYYGIEWQYEPNQFPLQWHEGRTTEMFAPDFYLPEYDMYIELTTMRQALVRRKNRKLRLLRALYPEINIKLLYRRDYQRLLERFGISPEVMEEQPVQEVED